MPRPAWHAECSNSACQDAVGALAKQRAYTRPNLIQPSRMKFSRGIYEAQRRGSDQERLFAGFLGLAILMVLTRWTVLRAAVWVLPTVSYQDILFWVAMVWMFDAALAFGSGSRWRRTVIVAGWVFCMATAAYTGLWTVVFDPLVIR